MDVAAPPLSRGDLAEGRGGDRRLLPAAGLGELPAELGVLLAEAVEGLDDLVVRGGLEGLQGRALERASHEVREAVVAAAVLLVDLGEGPPEGLDGREEDLGRKRVIQRRFNVTVPRARVPKKDVHVRDRSER